ncbi:hypothetical protein HHI36_023571 [Cryptolaemus montrouzieri]|uniref:R3H domain-containing protein n=1 Tax=Cryptolaemus montrouzieri TaxID=559131 RepID=A0ABD2PGY0_9CUCU
MTVISKTQKKCEFPNSNANSDTESLHLGSAATSDAESVHNEPSQNIRLIRNRRYIPQPFIKFEENPVFHKHGGKRKLRRYQNCTILQTLSEEENDEIFDIFESIKSPLSKLFEDPVALECWNQFIDKSEEEQKQIIKDLDLKDKLHECESSKSDKPYLRISSKIRRTLKIRRNLSVETVKLFEDDVIGFFNHFPQDKYVKYPDTSFERLLTHAVAQYHSLYSFSEWENEKRKVEIHNLKENWTPAECFLHELITKLRS